MRRFADRGWVGWTGLVLAPAAWALHHQAGSDLNYADCARHGQAVPIAIGLVALAVVVGAALVSGMALRRPPEAAAQAERRFIPMLSLMACGLFGLTILVQVAASALLPPCFR